MVGYAMELSESPAQNGDRQEALQSADRNVSSGQQMAQGGRIVRVDGEDAIIVESDSKEGSLALPSTKKPAPSTDERVAEPSPIIGADRGKLDASDSAASAKKAVPARLASEKTVVEPQGKGKNSGIPFDPIRENGEYFKGWTKPTLALVITGREDGYLEPCGCAGLERMKGGLSRRSSFLSELRQQRGWDVAALDVGGLSKGFGKQIELKYQTTVDAMRALRYDAIAVGKDDLRLPTAFLTSVIAGVGGKESDFVAANVALFDFDAAILPRKKIIQAGGMKLGVTAILGVKFQKEINNSDVKMIPPEEAIKAVLPELKKAGCDKRILLSHATMDESIALAKRFPEFDIVITAGGPAEPPGDKPRKVGEKTLLVDVGEKGMAAIVLGFYDGKPVRYQRVLLDSRYKPASKITALMEAYQNTLGDAGLSGLEIRPMPYPRAELQGAFVGSKKCETCHEESYRVWKKSGHAKAYETLVKAVPARNFDPECVSCHVVGWRPIENRPYESGFLTKKETPHLTDVGCESCHGPGGNHIAAEVKNDAALQKKMQQAMVVTKAESEKRLCTTCHDLDNSPDFEFGYYWPKVEHREKDKK
jgi:hypothetical protein